MPVHDFGYRAYEGERTGALPRVTSIAWSDIAQTFKTKKFLVFYVLCISPAIMAFVFVYIRFIVAEGQGEIAGLRFNRGLSRALSMVDGVEFYLDLGRGGMTVLTILFSAVVGAGIVSRDRRAGALEIYFTRGIRPWHYVAGKLLGVFGLLVSQVLLPFVAVWLFGVAVASEESGFVAKTTAFMPRVVLAQSFLCATLAFWMVALSTSTESTRFALLRWAGGLFGLFVVGNALWRRFDDASWLVVSPWKVARRITFEIAGANPWPEGFELQTALVGWLVLTAGAALWLRRHLRPVEVVA